MKKKEDVKIFKLRACEKWKAPSKSKVAKVTEMDFFRAGLDLVKSRLGRLEDQVYITLANRVLDLERFAQIGKTDKFDAFGNYIMHVNKKEKEEKCCVKKARRKSGKMAKRS